MEPTGSETFLQSEGSVRSVDGALVVRCVPATGSLGLVAYVVSLRLVESVGSVKFVRCEKALVSLGAAGSVGSMSPVAEGMRWDEVSISSSSK